MKELQRKTYFGHFAQQTLVSRFMAKREKQGKKVKSKTTLKYKCEVLEESP